MSTASGFYALHVQEGLAAIARKYFEFYSTKCTTSLEEAMNVLGLPLTPMPPVQNTVAQITHQAGTVAGIPGATATKPAKIPVKRAGNKTPSPHAELYEKDGPPVDGWCGSVMKKGNREGKYCDRPVNNDPEKGRGKYCTQCYTKSDAFGKGKGKAKAKTSAVAPGADLTPGSFSTLLPTSVRPKCVLKPLSGGLDMFIHEDSGLIYKAHGEIKVACGIMADGSTKPLDEKSIEIAKKMKSPYIFDDKIVYPEENETPQPTQLPAVNNMLPNIGASLSMVPGIPMANTNSFNLPSIGSNLPSVMSNLPSMLSSQPPPFNPSSSPTSFNISNIPGLSGTTLTLPNLGQTTSQAPMSFPGLSIVGASSSSLAPPLASLNPIGNEQDSDDEDDE